MSQMTANSPLSSTAPSQALDLASLTETLDHLLERYLVLLHQHQTLQEQLSQTLSLAFLSLAQANFQSSNGSRYGQDFYDERMQASTLLYASANSQTPSNSPDPPKLCINPSPSSSPIFSLLPTAGTNTPTPTPSSPEHSSSSEPSPKPSSDPSASTATPCTPSAPRDPLIWFGILVPPALRNAQCSFNHTARDLVPQIAGVVTQMRALEIEVRRVRKKMAKQRLGAKESVGIEKTK